MNTLDTAIGEQQVNVKLWDYNSLNITHNWKDNTIPTAPVDIDFSNYKFEFFLLSIPPGGTTSTVVTNYSINAGVLSTAFLSKTGTNHTVLNMSLMFQDIRDN